ncbi:MAG: hypothetical protein M1495_04340 [Bacteroidetes bacterium]|nr:hypothetical protein [Bacteroidota bacterium]
MSEIIKLIGANVIAGFVILIILSLNMRMSDSANQLYQDTFNQRNAITSAQILEYDFYKMGYGVTGNKILQADSSVIKYLSDVDNNGTVDTVTYYTGSKTALTSTANPNDMELFRKLNQTISSISIVTRFNLSYFDSSNANLSYASLTSQLTRAKIRTIQVLVKTELPDSTGNLYSPVDWRKRIRPRNLF